MTPIQDPFAQYVAADVLGHLPGITLRAMFGGYGIYQNGLIFAIIADDKLWFKVDDSNSQDYKAAGSHPFTYAGKGGQPHEMSYWELPGEIMEDKEEIRSWVAKSVAISQRKKK